MRRHRRHVVRLHFNLKDLNLNFPTSSNELNLTLTTISAAVLVELVGLPYNFRT